MEKKPRNLRKIILKSLLWAVCGLALLLIAATAGGIIYWNWYLPDYINDRLLPPVREQLGLDGMELRIRRIGLSGLDLETFTLTGAGPGRTACDRFDPGLTIPRTCPSVRRARSISRT